MNPPKARGLPVIAVIGKPNVGKSTLVNRLVARRASIVSPAEGITRDALERDVEWRGRGFTVVDTGGLVEDRALRRTSIAGEVSRRAVTAVSRADVVVFVVDAQSGLTADDFALAERLRKTTKPLILVANKIDDASAEPAASEAWSLGLGEPLAVSALHGRGSGELLDRIVDLLPTLGQVRVEEAGVVASIAIVGRPNVGKSSIFNRLAGGDRAIVHHEPGTTRDSIDTVVAIGGRRYRFVDTAGLRRRARTKGVEVYGAGRTREAIGRADLTLVVIDASEGATAQDQRIAEAVAEAGVGAVIVANKWDLVTGAEQAEAAMDSIKQKLRFVSYAPVLRTSATTGRGIPAVIREFEEVLGARSLRVPTARLNAVIHDAQQRTPARGRRGSARILYATQSGIEPPTFVLFGHGRPGAEWLRFIEHRLREEFGFPGTPLRLVVRERSRKETSRGSRRRN